MRTTKIIADEIKKVWDEYDAKLNDYYDLLYDMELKKENEQEKLETVVLKMIEIEEKLYELHREHISAMTSEMKLRFGS